MKSAACGNIVTVLIGDTPLLCISKWEMRRDRTGGVSNEGVEMLESFGFFPCTIVG